MGNPIRDPITVLAYWFSLPLIGYALLRASRDTRVMARRFGPLLRTAIAQSALVTSFLSLACAIGVLSVVALICYVCHAPAIVFTATYLTLLGFSLAFLCKPFVRLLFSARRLDPFKLRGQSFLVKMVFIVMCGLLVMDFWLGLYSRSHAVVSADTYVHLSRIVTILSQGFSDESGFFKGVAEAGYHYNVLYALYIVPAQLFHMMPADVWKYSFGFFRLVQWLSLYVLAWYVWKYWLKDRTHALLAASLSLIFMIAYFGGSTFFIATYPNMVVNLWLVLLVLSLSYYEHGKYNSIAPALLAALLATMTHPTYALMAAMFVVLLFLFKCLPSKDRIRSLRADASAYAGLVVLLMLGPLRTALYPNRISQKGLTLDGFPLLHLGPFVIKDPSYIAQYAPLNFGFMLLGGLGLVFVAYKAWAMNRQRLIVLGLLLFFPLVMYVPPSFTVLQKVLPLWVLARFTSMDVLRYLSIPLGVYALLAITRYLSNRYGGHMLRIITSERVLQLGGAVAVLLVSAFYLVHSYPAITQYREINEHYYSFMERTHQVFSGTLQGRPMVVANAGDSYFLAAVTSVNVLATEEGHMTPAADADDRVLCQKHILKTYALQDLRAVGADYILLSVYSDNFTQMRDKLNHTSYTKLANGDGDFLLYQVDHTAYGQSGLPDAYRPCSMYKQVEKS